MSDEVTDFGNWDVAPDPVAERDTTVLPFPSNRPLDEPSDVQTPPRLRDVIGEVLRDERLRQERTLADVADDAAVSLPYLSEVERGRKEMSSDVLHAIGEALELPLVEILERSADRLRTDVRMSVQTASIRMKWSPGFRLAA